MFEFYYAFFMFLSLLSNNKLVRKLLELTNSKIQEPLELDDLVEFLQNKKTRMVQKTNWFQHHKIEITMVCSNNGV